MPQWAVVFSCTQSAVVFSRTWSEIVARRVCCFGLFDPMVGHSLLGNSLSFVAWCVSSIAVSPVVSFTLSSICPTLAGHSGIYLISNKLFSFG